MVDAADLKSADLRVVGVRVSPWAPCVCCCGGMWAASWGLLPLGRFVSCLCFLGSILSGVLFVSIQMMWQLNAKGFGQGF